MSQTQTSELALTSVPDALTLLKNELKNLKEVTETQYKTGSDGKITGFGNSIQTETSISTLVKMHSSVSGRAKAYDSSLARLSELAGQALSAPVFMENGASLESLESDIAHRIKVLSVSERQKQLESLISEAQGFMTKEDQFKLFQAKIASALGK